MPNLGEACDLCWPGGRYRCGCSDDVSGHKASDSGLRKLALHAMRLGKMHEPAMSFDGVVLSPQKEVVRVFFKELWDKADKNLIPTIFHPDFTFRGSLGRVLRGHEQFAGYVDMVIGALKSYPSDILDMVEEGNKVCGKLRYHGYHHGENV